MITRPTGRVTVWFGPPLTTIAWPLMMSWTISDEPLRLARPSTHRALARAATNSAAMLLPPTVTSRSATVASERAASPCPTVVACSTFALSTPGTSAASSDASSAPPDGASGPASDNTVVMPSTVAFTTVARPLYVVLARLDELAARSGPVCGLVSEGSRSHAATAAASAANASMRFMTGLLRLRTLAQPGRGSDAAIRPAIQAIAPERRPARGAGNGRGPKRAAGGLVDRPLHHIGARPDGSISYRRSPPPGSPAPASPGRSR